MKVVLLAINSKYSHSMLSVRYLAAALQDEHEVAIVESNVNVPFQQIVGEVAKLHPDAVGVSCYIFNVETVKKVLSDLRKILPQARLILGGPEVSYEYGEYLPYCDYLIRGEGETALPALLRNPEPSAKVVEGRELLSLDELPDIYTPEYLEESKNKIVYYESSRGCPFRCAYCMSSLSSKVRMRSTEQTKRDMDRFQRAGLATVKFIDRTFNCNARHAEEILAYLVGTPGHTQFHFEVAADLFTEAMLQITEKLPTGRVRFEIGIQSFTQSVLESACRKSDLVKAEKTIERLVKSGNVTVHLDLIAGLPGETFDTFADSFNRAYRLKPDMLQLGFLKVLRGTAIRENAGRLGLEYSANAPYEVLSGPCMRYDELIRWKQTEESVSKFYNSSGFFHTLSVLEKRFENPARLHLALGAFMEANGFLSRPVSHAEKYEVLLGFARANGLHETCAKDLLRLDWLRFSPEHVPAFLNGTQGLTFFGGSKKTRVDFLLCVDPADGVLRQTKVSVFYDSFAQARGLYRAAFA